MLRLQLSSQQVKSALHPIHAHNPNSWQRSPYFQIKETESQSFAICPRFHGLELVNRIKRVDKNQNKKSVLFSLHCFSLWILRKLERVVFCNRDSLWRHEPLTLISYEPPVLWVPPLKRHIWIMSKPFSVRSSPRLFLFFSSLRSVHVWMCTFLCVHVWRPERILSSSVILCLIPIRRDLLLNLMLAILARLAGQKAPRTHPSLPLTTGVTGMHKLCLTFICRLGVCIQLLMHWAISLAYPFKIFKGISLIFS